MYPKQYKLLTQKGKKQNLSKNNAECLIDLFKSHKQITHEYFKTVSVAETDTQKILLKIQTFMKWALEVKAGDCQFGESISTIVLL